ncbi:MAG: redoxin domain-containing protein [Isosphaeraceae bacterium]
MSRSTFALLVLPCLVSAALLTWSALRQDAGRAGDEPEAFEEGPVRHFPTREMTVASLGMIDRAALAFRARATDGRTYDLGELLARGPVVLTFIKDGCPCSAAAQPYFNALHAAYPSASTLGVIDVEGEEAGRWAEANRPGYPLLCDPAGELIRGYGAENSAYVVLIDPRGRIARHWPGYSAAMLLELGATLAVMTGSPKAALDFRDAPSELYTGCPYDFEEAAATSCPSP